MPSWGRKTFVMTVIVSLHAAAAFGLAHIKRSVPDVAPHDAIVVRMISALPERPAPATVSVRPVVPTVTIEPPELPFFADSPVEYSPRAITVPVQTAAAAAATPVDVTAPKLISSVEYVREPKPRYPPMSRRLREEGLVMLRVLIDEKGHACSIEIESSSGYARLDDAAREAVSRAEFRPYVEDGQPRRAVVLIPIEFSLNRSA